jgi:hypothetical protein
VSRSCENGDLSSKKQKKKKKQKINNFQSVKISKANTHTHTHKMIKHIPSFRRHSSHGPIVPSIFSLNIIRQFISTHEKNCLLLLLL